jgi:hypothetical protein
MDRNDWLTLIILLILNKKTLCFKKAKPDRNKTDLHRFKPNSRTAFIDEQSNPSLLLRKEDAISRHRGHKQKRRFGRLIFIILLSL